MGRGPARQPRRMDPITKPTVNPQQARPRRTQARPATRRRIPKARTRPRRDNRATRGRRHRPMERLLPTRASMRRRLQLATARRLMLIETLLRPLDRSTMGRAITRRAIRIRLALIALPTTATRMTATQQALLNPSKPLPIDTPPPAKRLAIRAETTQASRARHRAIVISRAIRDTTQARPVTRRRAFRPIRYRVNPIRCPVSPTSCRRLAESLTTGREPRAIILLVATRVPQRLRQIAITRLAVAQAERPIRMLRPEACLKGLPFRTAINSC